MARQPRRHGGACRHVYGFEQPKREFRVMTLLTGRVRQLLHIEVGKDPQQRRTHIDPVAQSEIGEAFEAG